MIARLLQIYYKLQKKKNNNTLGKLISIFRRAIISSNRATQINNVEQMCWIIIQNPMWRSNTIQIFDYILYMLRLYLIL